MSLVFNTFSLTQMLNLKKLFSVFQNCLIITPFNYTKLLFKRAFNSSFSLLTKILEKACNAFLPIKPNLSLYFVLRQIV